MSLERHSQGALKTQRVYQKPLEYNIGWEDLPVIGVAIVLL